MELRLEWHAKEYGLGTPVLDSPTKLLSTMRTLGSVAKMRAAYNRLSGVDRTQLLAQNEALADLMFAASEIEPDDEWPDNAFSLI